MTTLDLIDKRIRGAVPGQRATVDVDPHAVSGPGEGYYYRIRKGGKFQPVLTIDVTCRSGMYHVRPDQDAAPYKSDIYNATTGPAGSSRVGFLANELDAPMDAIERLIKDLC